MRRYTEDHILDTLAFLRRRSVDGGPVAREYAEHLFALIKELHDRAKRAEGALPS